MAHVVNVLARPEAPAAKRRTASWVAAFALIVTLAPAPAPARAAPESFADLAEQVTGAVVNISASTTVETRNRTLPQLPQGTPFEDLFEEFFNRRGQGQGPGGDGAPRLPQQRRSNSLGSGFVIDPSGLVVTNNHFEGTAVVNALQLTALLMDRPVNPLEQLLMRYPELRDISERR